jgi:DnaD/phage-associated family protein
MEMSYIKVYKDFIDIVRELDNGARGRLFLAMLEYINGVETSNLTGAERIAFLSIKNQIDRDEASFSNTSLARSEAGKKGAEKRWNKERDMAIAIYANSKNGKHGNNKDKDKDKDKDNSVYVGLLDARLAQCNQCYEQNIGTISPTVSEAIQYWLEKVEPGLICEAIKTAVKRNSRRWAYIEGILKNCEKQNIRTADAFLSEQKKPSAPKNANPFLRDDI